MIQTTQLDFLTYTSAFKNDYKKGINRLKAILQSPSQAKALVNNLGGVSAIFGTPVDAPDQNSDELIRALHDSPYAEQAAKTWLSDLYTFGTWDGLLQDKGQRNKILDTPTHIRAIMSSHASASAVLNNPTYANEVITSPTTMDTIATSSAAMAEMITSPTTMERIVASEIALRAICESRMAADTVKTVIQQYRNTIIKTLSSPTLFSFQAPTGGNGAGNYEINIGAANIIICMSFYGDGNTNYCAYYGANTSELIYSQPWHNGTVDVTSNGVSMRGLKVVGAGSANGNFKYLLYTPK